MEKTPVHVITAFLKKCANSLTNFSFFIILTLGFLGCSTPTSRVKGENPDIAVSRSAKTSDREIEEFKKAQDLYAHSKFEDAIQALVQFEKKFPKTQFQSQVKNIKGLSYLLTKRAQLALIEFQRAATFETNVDFKPYVYFNLATAQYELGQFEESRSSLSQVFPSRMDKENRFKVFFLQARVLARVKQSQQAIRDFFSAARLMQESASNHLSQTFRSEIESAARQVDLAADLEKLYSENEDAPFADTLLYVLAKSDPSKMKLITERFSASPYLQEALTQVRAVQDIGPAEPKTIGVLLPLSGKYAEFGQRALQAIQLAVGVWDEPNRKNPNPFSVVFADSGDDPQKTLASFERLVRQYHPIAVIGPLLSKGSDLVAQRAEEFQIPLLTLSQQPGPNGSFTFHFGVTPQIQAVALAQFAFEHLQIKRFAIVYPRTKSGESFMNSFWDKIESLGGEINGIESFASGETDFRTPIDRLVGLYYPEARHLELDALTQQRNSLNIKKRTRKTENYFALKPIVDFEAVLIADDAQIAGQMLPTFAYRDVDHMRFLGPSSWNSDSLLSRADRHAEGAVFTSAFFNDTANEAVRLFADRYSTLYESLPAEIEALAFDAAKILTSQLSGISSPTDRATLRDRLKQLTEFKGATGTISYIGDSIVRSLTILTVKNGKIVEYSSQ